MRQVVVISLLLMAIWTVNVSAEHLSVTSSAGMTLDEDIVVAARGPTFVLTVRYPNGGYRIYDGERIPSAVTVTVGSSVELKFFARVGEKGSYITRARGYSITDLPSDEAREIIHLHAVSTAAKGSGNIQSEVTVDVDRYYEGLSVLLQVSFTSSTAQGSETFSKRVTVRCSPPIATFTFINPSSTTSETENSAQVVNPVNPIESSSTRRASSSSTSAKGSTHSSPREGQMADFSVTPPSQEVMAGEVAVFDLCAGLPSPSFGVERLPMGYRYVITPSGQCYKLKIFTHPLSYGTFEMTVVVKSGAEERRSSISLKVRRAETSTSQQSTATSEQGKESLPETTEIVGTSSNQPVTVIKIVKKEEPSTTLLAAGGLAGMLVLLLVLVLLKTRRR